MTDIQPHFPALTFFRQKRLDEGERIGVLIHGNYAVEHFKPGPEEEYDPSLIWSVDLECEGPNLPTRTEDALAWLSSHAIQIQTGLKLYSQQLAAGLDSTGFSPTKWREFPNPPLGVEMSISCEAMRRVDGQILGQVLKETSMQFVEYLQKLSSLEKVSHNS